jgi:hypothetical protein
MALSILEAPHKRGATPSIQVSVQRSVKTAADTQVVLRVEQAARRHFRDSSGGSYQFA